MDRQTKINKDSLNISLFKHSLSVQKKNIFFQIFFFFKNSLKIRILRILGIPKIPKIPKTPRILRILRIPRIPGALGTLGVLGIPRVLRILGVPAPKLRPPKTGGIRECGTQILIWVPSDQLEPKYSEAPVFFQFFFKKLSKTGTPKRGGENRCCNRENAEIGRPNSPLFFRFFLKKSEKAEPITMEKY